MFKNANVIVLATVNEDSLNEEWYLKVRCRAEFLELNKQKTSPPPLALSFPAIEKRCVSFTVD